jgi:lysozyme
MIFTRTIIDIYHEDDVDLDLLAQNGVSAVMCKATEGGTGLDPLFKPRIQKVLANGLLPGCYHFATAAPVTDQLANWFGAVNAAVTAEDIPKLAWEFDLEDNGSNTMSYDQACQFISGFRTLKGFAPLLYGSDLLFDFIDSHPGDTLLRSCPLSIASYNGENRPKLPPGWDHFTLWQGTGDGAGFSPHRFPGANNNLDVYQFDGTLAQLRAAWPFA